MSRKFFFLASLVVLSAMSLSAWAANVADEVPQEHSYPFGSTYCNLLIRGGGGATYNEHVPSYLGITTGGYLYIELIIPSGKMVLLRPSDSDIKKLRGDLVKAITWSKTAIEKNVDHEKNLGKFCGATVEWSSDINSIDNRRYVTLIIKDISYIENSFTASPWRIYFGGIGDMQQGVDIIDKILGHSKEFLAYKKTKESKKPKMSKAEKDRLFQ